MQTEILYQPSYSALPRDAQPGEQIRAEAGAMVSMGRGRDRDRRHRRLLEVARPLAAGRRVVLPEHLHGAVGRSGGDAGAGAAGRHRRHAARRRDDRPVRQLPGQHLGIDVTAKWGGAKSFFGGEGLFMLRCAGHGITDPRQLWRDPQGLARRRAAVHHRQRPHRRHPGRGRLPGPEGRQLEVDDPGRRGVGRSGERSRRRLLADAQSGGALELADPENPATLRLLNPAGRGDRPRRYRRGRSHGNITRRGSGRRGRGSG